MIRINPQFLYSRKDEEIVCEWLAQPENTIHKLLRKRWEQWNSGDNIVAEIPTGLTPESELGKKILEVSNRNPRVLELMIGHQSAILKIVSWETPVRAKVAEIMDIDNNYAVRPEVVITVWKK